MIVAEPLGPGWKNGRKQLEDPLARFELGAMALPVVEADRLDALVALERPGKAGGGVLASGEKNQGVPLHRK
jgi:hypothetical protein